jgi:hypothetical protein
LTGPGGIDNIKANQAGPSMSPRFMNRQGGNLVGSF